MLELLQAQPGLTGPELAKRLDVDGRTVRRYAGTLADLGVPVQAERGRYGGYRLLPGYKLPPLMLTDDEAVAVVFGLLVAARQGVTTPLALAKIERVLPAKLRERVQAVRETLGFTAPARESAPPATGHLLALGEAARSHRRVRVTYRSWRGDDTERDFDPYGVVVHNGRWYTAGHDHRSGEIRTLRLDRIGSITSLEVYFQAPDGFDPIAHVVAGLATVPYRHEVEVLLRIGLADAARRIPPVVGTLTDHPDGVLFTCRAERLDGMAQLLAGLGCDFTVHRPDELRAEVLALARRLERAAAGRRSVVGEGCAEDHHGDQ
ncbi:YafY family protein [Dactylosporangium sp. NPDC049525]|uniref:helix-turn-helix transcriptional regulator n=1 Tax=Dactylosporangium sp. NPDC049525 TaxID=3154730 RepID=UPI0034276AC0